MTETAKQGDLSRSERTRSSGLPRAALVAALVVVSAYFFVRGPYRAWRGTIDLHVFYSASRAWLLGRNPYDSRDLDAVFRDAGGTRVRDLSLNPPVTFVLLAPLAAVPWPVAEKAWTVLNVLLTGACLWALASHLGFRRGETRTALFVAFALALAPFHTAISQGQLTVAVTALVVFAFGAELGGREVLAGVCLGLATALKPQMALLFVLLHLCRRRWRSLAGAASTLAALGAIALGRMALAGVPWLPSWRERLSTFTEGGTGDPTTANPGRQLMINLHVVLHELTDNRLAVNLIVLAFVVVAGGAVLRASRTRRDSASELLACSMAAVLSLVGFYNRLYSATLLVLPLAWCLLAMADRPLRKPAILVAWALVPFVVPGAAIMNVLARDGPMRSLAANPWWQAATFHQVYALLVVAGALWWAAWRDGLPERGE